MRGKRMKDKIKAIKAHVSEHRAKYITGATAVVVASISALAVTQQDSEPEEYEELCDEGWNDGGWDDGWEWDEDGDVIGRSL